MASQQLYSRVPAKMSLFNRTDSFDTFACSADLDRTFIEKDLAVLCENRLTPQEAARLRTQPIDSAYYQFATKDGQLVQSCISYLQTDYTGERSAYLVHNVIFGAEESERVLCQSDYDVLNDDAFIKDVARFDLTNPAAKPITDYPEADFVPRQSRGTEWILHTFDLMMVKRFIYAALAAACGKLKGVYFVMPNVNDPDIALHFINDFLQVMPYHLRGELSFATKITDYAKFPNIKIKVVSPDMGQVPVSRGITFDFLAKTVSVDQTKDISANGSIVEFFYSLLTNDALRREFLRFAHNAVAKVPALGALDLKVLAQLVFLFRSGSDLFDEAAILPTDEKVEDFFVLYEKARFAMSDEYRIKACKSLLRYPASHTAIPKTVFAKLGKIYPTEIEGTKRVIMSVVLDLIHTDVMREKLFGFIRANYKGENPETKKRICDDLARVFYGGFLQQQILDFFNSVFASEPVETRDFIVEKVLLAIRTKSVQEQILAFLDAHYNKLSPASRDLVYATMVENLPFGDELSLALADWIDRHIGAEKQAVRQLVAKEMCAHLEAEQRHKQKPMLEVLPKMRGFAYNMMVGVILRAWNGRKIFTDWADIVCALPMVERTQEVERMWSSFDFIDDKLAAKLLTALEESSAAHPVRGDVYALLAQDASFRTALHDTGLPAADAFADGYCRKVLRPALWASALDIFRHPERTGGAEELVRFAQESEGMENDRVRAVADYLALKQGLIQGDPRAYVKHLEALPRDKALRHAVADYLKAELRAAESVRASECMVKGVLRYLSTGDFGMSTVYDERQADSGADGANAKASKKKLQEMADERRHVALVETLTAGADLYEYADTQELREAITGESAEIREVLSAYANQLGKHGVSKAQNALTAMHRDGNGFVVYCRSLLAGIKPPKRGLFGK